jgi:transcriptional antiterminator RfaH
MKPDSAVNHWYLIHTKIRQERIALTHLERQGYTCFLPLIQVEKVRRHALQVVEEPLFPRYLFIRLGTGLDAPSWGPIRSTQGVSRLVTFGQTPARVHDLLIDDIRAHSARAERIQRRFEPGEPVTITQGPFVGIEAIYQMSDGEGRVMVLFDMLSREVSLKLPASAIRKAA